MGANAPEYFNRFDPPHQTILGNLVTRTMYFSGVQEILNLGYYVAGAIIFIVFAFAPPRISDLWRRRQAPPVGEASRA
jgi:hypothetical protein